MEYFIKTPKTEKDVRYVPMSDEVRECFKRILENRKKPKIEPMINGKCRFLYLDKNNMPMVALHWEKYFQHIREKYNKIYKKELPVTSPHVAKHTFCSNIAKSGVNLCRVIPKIKHLRRFYNDDKNIIYLPWQEANTSLEMLIFSKKNANYQMNLQRFYRGSKNR